jgi:hypothetical protein
VFGNYVPLACGSKHQIINYGPQIQSAGCPCACTGADSCPRILDCVWGGGGKWSKAFISVLTLGDKRVFICNINPTVLRMLETILIFKLLMRERIVDGRFTFKRPDHIKYKCTYRTLKMRPPCCLETSVFSHPVRQRHIAEERRPQILTLIDIKSALLHCWCCLVGCGIRLETKHC